MAVRAGHRRRLRRPDRLSRRQPNRPLTSRRILMASQLTPHLHFDGTARDAMQFYAGVFGGDIDFHTFAEIGCGEAVASDADLLRGYWEKLSADGTVTMPLAEQVWGDEFGMCVDTFGVPWMVNISRAE